MSAMPDSSASRARGGVFRFRHALETNPGVFLENLLQIIENLLVYRQLRLQDAKLHLTRTATGQEQEHRTHMQRRC